VHFWVCWCQNNKGITDSMFAISGSWNLLVCHVKEHSHNAHAAEDLEEHLQNSVFNFTSTASTCNARVCVWRVCEPKEIINSTYMCDAEKTSIKDNTLNQNASKPGSRQVGTAATTVLPTVRRSDMGEERCDLQKNNVPMKVLTH